MSKRDTCEGCPHLHWGNSSTPMLVADDVGLYFCGMDDLIPLDSNEPGPWIGFLPIKPDWCPLVSDTLYRVHTGG